MSQGPAGELRGKPCWFTENVQVYDTWGSTGYRREMCQPHSSCMTLSTIAPLPSPLPPTLFSFFLRLPPHSFHSGFKHCHQKFVFVEKGKEVYNCRSQSSSHSTDHFLRILLYYVQGCEFVFGKWKDTTTFFYSMIDICTLRLSSLVLAGSFSKKSLFKRESSNCFK